MKSSFKTRAAAMVASVATTFVLVHGIAVMGHRAIAPDATAEQVAGAPSSMTGT